ncbi:MAG TPA: elongation factor 1-beta [archaeon]|nr:elongation factor 1-beta [archaeon]
MGSVAVSMKISAESAEVDLNKVKDEIAKRVKVQDFKLEPIAFGLKCLKILVIVPDEKGENISEEIKRIKGVGDVEVESATLV